MSEVFPLLCFFAFFVRCNRGEQLNYDLQVNSDYESILLRGYNNLEVTGSSDANVDYWIARKSDYDEWVSSGHLSTIRVISGAMCDDCRDFFFNFSVSASDSYVVVISGMYPPTSADVEVDIHASRPSSDNTPACFSADSLISLSNGQQVPIIDISVGDEILGVDGSGKITATSVVYIPHLANSRDSDFVAITYSFANTSHTIQLTPKHLLPVCLARDCSTCSSSAALFHASEVTLESCIRIYGRDTLLWSHPDSIVSLRKSGVYSLVTKAPFLLVNGVVASPFETNHMLSRYFYAAHSLLYSYLPFSLWAEHMRYFTDFAALAASFVV